MLSLLLNFLRAVLLQPFAGLTLVVPMGFSACSDPTAHAKPTTSPWQGYGVRLSQVMLGLVLVWISTTTPAWAEAAFIEDTPSIPTQVNSADIPSDQVNQFVEAYLQVVALIDARDEDLKRAATEAESLQLQQATQAEAYGLIEAAGLTRQTYWQLLGLANSDAEFRDRVLAQLEERDS